jgi:DNA replication protein DnaC
VPVGHPNFGKAFRCTCQLDDLQSRQLDRLRRLSNMEQLKRLTFDSFLPDGYGLDERPRRSLRLAFERAFAFARKPQGWLLLRGSYGCGKTHLAAAIANECLSRGQPVLFVNVPDLLDHLRSTYGPSSEVSFDERFEEVRDAPVIILDDLGTQNATPWAQEKLYQILNHRYNAQLPTVVTTNQDLEDIEPRLRSRLLHVDFVAQVRILAPDFRGAGAVHPQQEVELSVLKFHHDQTFDSFNLRQERPLMVILRQNEQPVDVRDNLRRAFLQAQHYAAEQEPHITSGQVDNRGSDIEEIPAPNTIPSEPALRPNWLILTGAHGCGKTHLAAAIANELGAKGYQVVFIPVPDLLDYLRAAFDPQTHARYDKRFDEVRTAAFLVLDDLGTENASPWAREKLYQIINYRYVARLPTIITSAWSIQELEQRDPTLAARILDRARCTRFAILAPSYYEADDEEIAYTSGKSLPSKRKSSSYRRKY